MRWDMLYQQQEHQDLLHSTGNSAQHYAAAWMGGEFGGEWIQIWMAESLAIHLKVPQHCYLALL